MRTQIKSIARDHFIDHVMPWLKLPQYASSRDNVVCWAAARAYERGKLKPRDYLILHRRLYDHKTLSQIAATLGISTDRTRQIESVAYARMYKDSRNNPSFYAFGNAVCDMVD